MTRTATKKQKLHCISDDFLKANQHFKIVVDVLSRLLRDLGYNTLSDYNVVALSEFARYTYIYSRKFSHGVLMDKMMEELSDKGVSVDLKDPELRRFRVCLSIPLVLIEKYVSDKKVYEQAVKLSPVYENTPAQGNGHVSPRRDDNGSASATNGLEETQKVEPEPSPPPASSVADVNTAAAQDGIDSGVLEEQVKLVAKRLGLAVVFARKGQDQGFVCQLHIKEEQAERARAYDFYKRAGFDVVVSKLLTGGDGVGKLFKFRTSVLDPELLEMSLKTLLPAADTAVSEVSPPMSAEAEGVDDEAGRRRDEAVKESLMVKHPKSILTAAPQNKKRYLSRLITEHGNGLKLTWVPPPIGEEQDDQGWRVRDGSGDGRSQDLQDLLTLWGYDVSPGPTRRSGQRGALPNYFYLNRLEPTEMAQFYEDGKIAHHKKMAELRQKLVPPEDLVATKDLEDVLVENWKPDMPAEELLKLLRKDIRTLGRIANMAHIHELTAEALVDQVLEAMGMLRAVPIVESTEVNVSIAASGLRVGLAVRPDTFKSMLTERILYLFLRNSLFRFRNGSGEG